MYILSYHINMNYGIQPYALLYVHSNIIYIVYVIAYIYIQIVHLIANIIIIIMEQNKYETNKQEI